MKDQAEELYVVVVGCGRVGAYVAERYSMAGASVVVVDHEPQAFAELSPEFSGFTIEGDAREFAVLQQAKVANADGVFALTHSDNLNAMVGSIAKHHFGVDRVVVRVEDPVNEAMFGSMGLEVICPTSIAAQQAVHDVLQISTKKNRAERTP